MKKLLFLFTSLLLIISCSDDSGSGTADGAAFEGTWAMTSYRAFTPDPIPVDEGDILWDFNTEAQTVTMSNKGESYMSPKGTFDYTLEEGAIVVALNNYDQRYFFVFDQQGLRLQGDNAVMRFEKY